MRNTARNAVSLQRWHGKIYLHLREERQPVLAKPYRVESRAFSSISRQTACTRSRNFTRNRAISRVPARRYAISWVHARFALSHTFSRKCNQQFRSGYMYSHVQASLRQAWSPAKTSGQAPTVNCCSMCIK